MFLKHKGKLVVLKPETTQVRLSVAGDQQQN
jgi:hypothetical protein